jgi:hypothetical protein
MIPGRDEKWQKQTIENTSQRQFNQEYNCVTGDTVITVRNKHTGITEEVAFVNFINRLEVSFLE